MAFRRLIFPHAGDARYRAGRDPATSASSAAWGEHRFHHRAATAGLRHFGRDFSADRCETAFKQGVLVISTDGRRQDGSAPPLQHADRRRRAKAAANRHWLGQGAAQQRFLRRQRDGVQEQVIQRRDARPSGPADPDFSGRR